MLTLAFCAETWSIWKLVGDILTIFKIVIPIIIIIMGAIDLGKAVVSSKEDEIKKATGSLMRRFIAGIIIFFIPTIVSVVFNVLDNFGEIRKDYTICSTCVSTPSECRAVALDYCDYNDEGESQLNEEEDNDLPCLSEDELFPEIIEE